MASFMVHGDSHNWIFHGHEWPYSTRPGPWQNRFWATTERAGAGSDDPPFLALLPWLAVASVGGTIASRIGLAWGNGCPG